MTPLYFVFGLSILFYVHAGYIQHNLYQKDETFVKSVLNYIYLLIAPILLIAVSFYILPLFTDYTFDEKSFYTLVFYGIMFPIVIIWNGVFLFMINHTSKSIAKIKQEQEQEVEELSDEKKNLS